MGAIFESDWTSSLKQYRQYYSERFIYRDELSKIAEIIRNNNSYRILVLGTPGSGKTTLLYLLSHCIMDNDKEIIARQDPFNHYCYYNSLIRPHNPLLIDGLDEMQAPHELLKYLDEKRYDRLVCTSRSNLAPDGYFSHVIHLAPLTQDQIALLFQKLRPGTQHLHPMATDRLSDGRPITPRDVLQSVITNMSDLDDIEDFYSKYSNFLYRYGDGIDFSSDAVPMKRKLIVPSQEVITSVKILDDTLLKKAMRDPQIVHKFSPREFEKMICELLSKQGYDVTLTKQTRDGGKDIIVLRKSMLGEFCIYVECKKYDKTRPISVGLVRELYGTVEADKATAGMMITTSYFSKAAKEFTEQIKHRMTLKDYNDLVQALSSITT